MNIDKAISIRCGGEADIQLKALNHFQGKLKSITADDFQKLKRSLVKHGLPLAFHVWVDDNDKIWIIDGHHRRLALLELEAEGYFIPPLPCNIVNAKTQKEAAQILLVSNSRYAKMTQESISDYMIEMDLQLPDLEDLDIPELNMNDFSLEIDDIEQDSLLDIEENFNFIIKCHDHEEFKSVQAFFETEASKVKYTSVKDKL